MDFRENNNHGHPSNGFLLGVIVGGITTLLFTTKKGREIVKDLTEKGMDKFSEIQQNLDEAVEAEEIDGEDYVEPVDRETEKESKLLAGESEKSKSPTKSPIRRLFKTSKKN